jgi:hypothetical protein
MKFPNTYGEVMAPFDAELLCASTANLYAHDLKIRTWIDLYFRVRRAEKVSSWTQWTAEERKLYSNEEYRRFSRLRGYTES